MSSSGEGKKSIFKRSLKCGRTYHIDQGEQGITYVDVVFPAFLFIVGMAIPLAIKKRKSSGVSKWNLMYHTIIRSLSLVVIGLLIMNSRGRPFCDWHKLYNLECAYVHRRNPIMEHLPKNIGAQENSF